MKLPLRTGRVPASKCDDEHLLTFGYIICEYPGIPQKQIISSVVLPRWRNLEILLSNTSTVEY